MTANVEPPVRFHHIDALRGPLMISVVLVHVGTLGHSGLFWGIQYVMALVQMEAFMAVSGFLTAMLVVRYGVATTVVKRLLSLGVPLVAALVLLNPATIYLIYCFHNDPVTVGDFIRGRLVEDPAGPANWHLHLWFLFVLIAYAALTPVFAKVLGSVQVVRAAERVAALRRLAFPALVMVFVGASVASRLAYRTALEPVVAGTPIEFLSKATSDYLPYFALGFVLFHAATLRSRFTGYHWVMGIAAVGGVVALEVLADGLDGQVFSLVELMAEDFVAVVALAAMFALAERLVTTDRPSVRYLSDGSFTVYLFHFVVVYAVASMLDGLIGGTPLMLVVTVLTLGATLAIHHFMVLPSTFMRAVFNGKIAWPRPRGASASASATEDSTVRGWVPQRSGPATHNPPPATETTPIQLAAGRPPRSTNGPR